MEYNTSRDKLVMPEYGRHIQKMVDYLPSIADPEERQNNAEYIIELMGALNPQLRIVDDFRHILWDHLFQISDYKLDIQSPYPKPTCEQRNAKPEPIPYPKSSKKRRHLGKNINIIIERALAETDADKKRGFTNTIAYYMKLAYTNWHHEPVHDDMIKEELREISKGNLVYDGGDIKVRFDNRQQANNHRRNGKGHKNGSSHNNKNGRKPNRNN